MGHKRVFTPESFASGDDLTAKMVGIGMRFAERAPKLPPNIEDTLIAASIEGLKGDFRVLSLLVDWVDVHFERINVDRLTRLASTLELKPARAFWSAIAQWKKSDTRFSRLARMYRGPRVELVAMTPFLQAGGEDERFIDSVLYVPAKLLRHRKQDVLTPAELARKHDAYHHRVLIGPSYRADMWAELSRNPDLTAGELARRCYGSYRTAWQVRRDFNLLKQAP